MRNCNNVIDSYDIEDSEDCKFIYGENLKNCYDLSGGGAEFCYDSVHVGWGNNNMFSNDVIESNSIFYSLQIYYSNHCFGCIGLWNKEYCILNKQYTREEYEKLVPKIISHMMKIGEWGEFFSATLSPFGYNETVAQEYYPLTRGEVVSPDLK